MNIILFEKKSTRAEYLLMGTAENKSARGRIVIKDNDYDGLCLAEIKVSPRGQGIGSAFLQEVLARENLTADELSVEPDHKREVKFFQRNGFTRIACPVYL